MTINLEDLKNQEGDKKASVQKDTSDTATESTIHPQTTSLVKDNPPAAKSSFKTLALAAMIPIALVAGVVYGSNKGGSFDIKNPPELIKKMGEITSHDDLGNFYVLHIKGSDGNMRYNVVSKDGKYLLPSFIYDIDKNLYVYDDMGKVPDNEAVDYETAQKNNDPAAQVGDEDVFKSTLPSGIGMPEDYFKADLNDSSNKFYYNYKGEYSTPAIGKYATPLDLFSRHVADILYNGTLHSDSTDGKYKNSPHQPVYVFYDPRCPACQREIPRMETVRGSDNYDIIYIPTLALGLPAENDTQNPAFEQALAGVLGKDSFLNTLKKTSEYTPSTPFKASDEERSMVYNNTYLMQTLTDNINDNYRKKYGDKVDEMYELATNLGVPSMIYFDRGTGEAKYALLTNSQEGEFGTIDTLLRGLE